MNCSSVKCLVKTHIWQDSCINQRFVYWNRLKPQASLTKMASENANKKMVVMWHFWEQKTHQILTYTYKTYKSNALILMNKKLLARPEQKIMRVQCLSSDAWGDAFSVIQTWTMETLWLITWLRSESVELRSNQLQLPSTGESTGSTSLTHQVYTHTHTPGSCSFSVKVLFVFFRPCGFYFGSRESSACSGWSCGCVWCLSRSGSEFLNQFQCFRFWKNCLCHT